MKTKKENQNQRKEFCEGCINIKLHNFPFGGGYEGIDGFVDYNIDQEGCGIQGQQFLKIYYCPVCGKKLETNSNKP